MAISKAQKKAWQRFDNSRAKRRTCPHCQAEVIRGEPDPCLGHIPGLIAGCCGHGRVHMSYLFFETGLIVRHFDLIEFNPPGHFQEGLYTEVRSRPPAPPTAELKAALSKWDEDRTVFVKRIKRK